MLANSSTVFQTHTEAALMCAYEVARFRWFSTAANFPVFPGTVLVVVPLSRGGAAGS
jgi:hypothetical protein